MGEQQTEKQGKRKELQTRRMEIHSRKRGEEPRLTPPAAAATGGKECTGEGEEKGNMETKGRKYTDV